MSRRKITSINNLKKFVGSLIKSFVNLVLHVDFAKCTDRDNVTSESARWKISQLPLEITDPRASSCGFSDRAHTHLPTSTVFASDNRTENLAYAEDTRKVSVKPRHGHCVLQAALCPVRTTKRNATCARRRRRRRRCRKRSEVQKVRKAAQNARCTE